MLQKWKEDRAHRFIPSPMVLPLFNLNQLLDHEGNPVIFRVQRSFPLADVPELVGQIKLAEKESRNTGLAASFTIANPSMVKMLFVLYAKLYDLIRVAEEDIDWLNNNHWALINVVSESIAKGRGDSAGLHKDLNHFERLHYTRKRELLRLEARMKLGGGDRNQNTRRFL